MGYDGRPRFWGFAIIAADPGRILDRSEMAGSDGYVFDSRLEVSAPGKAGPALVHETGPINPYRRAVSRSEFLGRAWTVSMSADVRPGQLAPGGWIFVRIWICSVLLGIAVGSARYLLKFNRALMSITTQLESLSITDQMTGLLNRGGFSTSVENWIAAHPGQNACLAILVIDDFKRLNDVYGHAVGDAALRRFASELQDEFGMYGAPDAWAGTSSSSS